MDRKNINRGFKKLCVWTPSRRGILDYAPASGSWSLQLGERVEPTARREKWLNEKKQKSRIPEINCEDFEV